MIDAAKRKSISPPGLSALWSILLLVVALCLPETRVWGFAATPQPASGVFESASPSSVGEFTTATAYDVSGSPVAAKTTVRHGPMNPGPLADDIANTFRSGSYTARTLDQPTTLYRVIGDTGNPAGSYWTATRPQGPLQSVIDLALDQNWGNTATTVIRAQVPAGTRIYEGAAAAQRGLVGGGNQIYIPQVNPSWIQP